MDHTQDPRDRLIVGLDVPSVDEARDLVQRIGDAAQFYKVGLEIVMSGGLSLVRELRDQGLSVFLDVKLLDIANTVEKSVAQAAASGANFLTVHGTDTKTIAAAARGAEGTSLRILGVTVLTSLDQADLAEQGIQETPADLVTRRARLTLAAGGHGVIASGREASAVRAALGPDALVVTPGIRLPENDANDQARVSTPGQAIRDGASHIVVARPIIQAPDPRAAAKRFQSEIAAAVL